MGASAAGEQDRALGKVTEQGRLGDVGLRADWLQVEYDGLAGRLTRGHLEPVRERPALSHGLTGGQLHPRREVLSGLVGRLEPHPHRHGVARVRAITNPARGATSPAWPTS